MRVEFSKYRWVICECCEGEGKTGHPAFANGITSSEWNEWDEEDRRNYMDGMFDVTCEHCKGRGSVKVPDVSRMTFAEKRELVVIRRNFREDREIERIHAIERAMGA
ncbi:TPA: hypothetical protein JD053_16695 [Klebsiella michiganensis]|uniref:hypothetical protein n=1 Tax=Escherichia coli TaxID=562 RepID=UPI0003BE338B|nr:hypothetical protein [Escherichia coli]AUV95820.1 hypothetical protein C2U44_33175 [Klebsiella oxytoca]EDF6232774.1 hypothetical protein [Salmonella enterica subsp. enterica serovar Senftenberg]EIX9725642.1 hypothetical protein [Klebsiella pneumoniae]EIY9028125.1 hypothetical protein [Salmonella enterica]EKY3945783.1 hypothetical protein [Enterobacter hormaechei]ELO5146969.1 hypothetical protein [Citrobacter freundii]ESL45299.1 hypothetical protein L460_05130 [Klebsiella pneumoniae BIDMC 